MNKQELKERYEEIISNTNNYAIALLKIGVEIDLLDEPKQDTKWQKLKKWVAENKYKQLDDRYIERLVDVVDVDCLLLKMQELEEEDGCNIN